MNPALLHAIFYWILPLSISLSAFFIFLNIMHRSYEKTDVDRVWKVSIRIGIALGIIALIYVLFITVPVLKMLTHYIDLGLTKLGNTQIMQATKNEVLKQVHAAILFFKNWIPVYLRAVVLVWVPAISIWILGLYWRIKFTRALNIVVRTIFLFPYLTAKYFFGYQTPFFDYVQAKLYVAKIKENLNDSYFDALQGIDETGKKFDNGQGGTVKTQSIKAATLAIRQTKSHIKTANGVRHAQLVVRHSRETSTDQLIEQSLKGLGLRLSAPSIRFQEDPLLNPERGGYIFDSDVKYSTSDALGSWIAIFINPFSKENRIVNGGNGALKVIGQMYKQIIDYLDHLTPTAIYEKIIANATKKYTPDVSTARAKYKAQQNLDLSVIPEPADEDTGATVDMLKVQALKVANDRVSDVTDALTRFKLNVSFNKVLVGGNTAVYEYTLSRSANIPTDFSKIQEGLANLLKINAVPLVRTTHGNLIVTMVNGVNIPVDFREMILKRPKGLPEIISGIAGVDALGNIIDFTLGQRNPHAMLFGKTGTGKTVLIMNILYSIMSATAPDHLKIAYVDGKGNSFEFMRTDNEGSPSYHPNPFTYCQPADGSGDIDYARAVVQHLVKECRRRIELFKQRGVSKLDEFNKKYPDEFMPEILAVCDEFSALTDSDAFLKASELASKGMTDAFEYLAKMARSTGIRLLLANQTARKEKVPGRITANITGRVSLGVTEPIESDIALPDSHVALHLVDQPGEFYSTMHGARNVQHGNTPYLTDDTMYKLNDSLEKKFGHHDYVFTREEILQEMDGGTDIADTSNSLYEIPVPLPTAQTEIATLIQNIRKYPEWAVANRHSPIFTKNENIKGTPSQEKKIKQKIEDAFRIAEIHAQTAKEIRESKTRSNSGNEVAAITHGSDEGNL